MTGRITQLGISRWTEKGGSYRTIQRFFHTEIDWLAVKWRFFTLFCYDPNGIYLLAGDESVVTKSGKHTFGLDRFFASLYDKAVPGLAFFSMALVHVGNRHAYSLSNEQVVRTDEEKQQARQRKQKQKSAKQQKTSPPDPPQKPCGRPKGSKTRTNLAVICFWVPRRSWTITACAARSSLRFAMPSSTLVWRTSWV